MNKKKGIIIGVFALVITMVVGYALFGKNIEITGTATAKGEFNITTTCQPGLIPVNLDVGSENGYKNDTCSVTGDQVTMHTDLLYPGAARFFTVAVKNTGSMKIVIKEDGGFTFNEKENYVDFYMIENDTYIGRMEYNQRQLNFTFDDFFTTSDQPYAIEYKDQIYLPGTEDFDTFYKWNGQSHPGDLILSPGATAYFYNALVFPSTIEGTGEIYYKPNVTYGINFTQQTED